MQDLRDTVSELESEVREAVLLVDESDSTTGPYFASEVGDLGTRAEEARDELLEREAEPDAAALRRGVIDAADRLANAAQDASLAYDDPKALADARRQLEEVGRTLDGLANGS